jgi:hypothetical protein
MRLWGNLRTLLALCWNPTAKAWTKRYRLVR